MFTVKNVMYAILQKAENREMGASHSGPPYPGVTVHPEGTPTLLSCLLWTDVQGGGGEPSC